MKSMLSNRRKDSYAKIPTKESSITSERRTRDAEKLSREQNHFRDAMNDTNLAEVSSMI